MPLLVRWSLYEGDDDPPGKMRAVWYKRGESRGGFWSEREMERTAERKAEACFEESPRKERVEKKEALVLAPQLRR